MDSLISFLSQFSILCLKAYLKSTVLPNDIRHENWKIFLASKFISYINKNDNEIFEDFVFLVKGNMGANALLCPDLQQATGNYKNVTFYLDSPLLISILGLHGKFQKEAILELIELIQKLKGKLSYFSHTKDEATKSIQVAATFIDSSQGRGPIVIDARKNNRTRSDLILISEKVEELLSKHKITIEQTPNYKNHSLQIDENSLEKLLSEKINYQNPNAIKRDINSVRSIYVLRRGTTSKSIEKSKAILVTNNAAFAKFAYKYGEDISNISQEVSTVITDFTLANIAWLKNPAKAPLLPQKEILAYAYASIQPSDTFITRVIEESDKLKDNGDINERDHQLLRSSILSHTMLMNHTLGEDKQLTGKCIKDTLKEIVLEIKKEGKEKLNQEKNDHIETQKNLDIEKQKNQKFQKSLYGQAKSDASFISKAICCFLFIIISCTFIIYHFLIQTNSVLSRLVLALVFIFTILSCGFGFSVMRIYPKLEKRILNHLLMKRKKKLGIE